MEAKHTPMAQVGENAVHFLRRQEDGSRWLVGTKLYAETNLIAAAPELLAALRDALHLIELIVPLDGDVTRNIRKAIAKATQQPPLPSSAGANYTHERAMDFKKGDGVTWTSQSNGYVKTKSGVVEAVIHAGVRPSSRELDCPGHARNHTSYLVRVPGKTSYSQGKLYWPRTAGLKPTTK